MNQIKDSEKITQCTQTEAVVHAEAEVVGRAAGAGVPSPCSDTANVHPIIPQSTKASPAGMSSKEGVGRL